MCVRSLCLHTIFNISYRNLTMSTHLFYFIITLSIPNIKDPEQRFISVVRFYMSCWHTRPKVLIISLYPFGILFFFSSSFAFSFFTHSRSLSFSLIFLVLIILFNLYVFLFLFTFPSHLISSLSFSFHLYFALLSPRFSFHPFSPRFTWLSPYTATLSLLSSSSLPPLLLCSHSLPHSRAQGVRNPLNPVIGEFFQCRWNIADTNR